MIAAEHYPYRDFSMLNHQLLEIHRSKISLHYAKQDYRYPTIRLPHRFSVLAGLSTHIFQTVHDGALAFLVVVSPTSEGSRDKHKNAPSSACTPYLHGGDQEFESPRANLFL
jgi:hypothetical protein